MSMTGKTAVVTGGSRGIGKAICLDLARQGANVVFSYAGNTAAAEETLAALKELGVEARAVQGDVADPAAVKALIDTAVKELGGLHILVNNAGITRDNLSMMMKDEDFDAVIATNLKGAFLCMRAAARPMMKARYGRIINLSSVVALRGNPGQINYCASKAGVIAMTESEQMRCSEKGFDRASPFYIPSAIANMGAGLIAIAFGFKGMCTCPVTACAGGSNAVGDAFRHIRDGYAEVMLCGGAESAVTPLSIGGFTTMRALHVGDDPNRASIPFDAERSGFVMGEGAGILMLEEHEHAKARGAKIYAEVVGYGATCDAYHMTAPAPNGEGGARAMAQALADGGVAPEQVGYINAHGTSTPLNDSGETAAIKAVFGGHAAKLAVSSTKSMTGHMLGAAGAVEAIFTALALKEGYLPATINYQVPDPACDLDYVPNQGRQAQVEYALSNSLGFGGHNACVLFKKWEG